MITSTVQPSSRSIFGFALAFSLVSPEMVPRDSDLAMNPSTPQISNSSIVNDTIRSNQVTTPAVENGIDDASIEMQKLTENLQDLNLLLLKIEQQLLNPSQDLDASSLQQQLDTIRRGSGL
jgi:hypothetical protein